MSQSKSSVSREKKCRELTTLFVVSSESITQIIAIVFRILDMPSSLVTIVEGTIE